MREYAVLHRRKTHECFTFPLSLLSLEKAKDSEKIE
jgi:hypothetical protein